MRINGKWRLDENGVLTPVIVCELLTGRGKWVEAIFLVDSGAERTVLSTDDLNELDAPAQLAPHTLMGISGSIQVLTVKTRLKFALDRGSPVHINGPFDGIPEGREGELSILGRDVLGNFAVILDRPGGVIALLHGRHRYAILDV